MKKVVMILMTLGLMLSLAAAGFCESLFVDNRETDKIHPERLNLRTEPSKKGAILGLYYTGAEVENLGAENEEYTKVCIGGLTGYMATEYLITREEAQRRYGDNGGFDDYRAAEVDLTGMWMGSVALLEEPGAQAGKLGELKSGDPVSLVGVLDHWAYIAAQVQGENGGKKTYGYVPLDCLTDVGALKVSIVAGEKADSRVFLYSAPNNRADQLMALKNGTACFTLFGRQEGQWRKVRVGGVTGWIKPVQTGSLYDLGDQERSVVPYYPLMMQTKTDVLLCSAMGDKTQPFMTLGKEMKVEVLAECGEYGYVRTLEGGAGEYDCGDFGYVKLSELSLTQVGASIGVAQADNDDVPVVMLRMPDAQAEAMGALCPGAQVRIVEYTQTDYVQVALGEMRGYIPKSEIRVLTRAGDRASSKIPQRAKIIQDTELKNSPSEKSKDGTPIAAGERVYMLGTFGSWAFVRAADHANLDVAGTAPDCTGFVQLEALTAPAGTTHLIAFANTDKVNLRSRASSTEGQIIGKVRTGMRLRIADYGKNWCLVVTPEGKRGYMMTKYLDFE